MPLNKRPPAAFPDGEIFWQFYHLSKATWADLYADLYRQCMGEDAPADEIMADAYKRMGILAANGIIPRVTGKAQERGAVSKGQS